MMDNQLPDQQPALRVAALVADSNPNGTMFGGWLMSQVDIAGSIPAFQASQGSVATVAVKHMTFHQPVLISDLLSFYANLVKTGTTSMTVSVEVWAQRNPAAPQVLKVADAELVYVAIDSQGQPRAVIPQAD